jgi:hypothetical protein
MFIFSHYRLEEQRGRNIDVVMLFYDEGHEQIRLLQSELIDRNGIAR